MYSERKVHLWQHSIPYALSSGGQSEERAVTVLKVVIF